MHWESDFATFNGCPRHLYTQSQAHVIRLHLGLVVPRKNYHLNFINVALEVHYCFAIANHLPWMPMDASFVRPFTTIIIFLTRTNSWVTFFSRKNLTGRRYYIMAVTKYTLSHPHGEYGLSTHNNQCKSTVSYHVYQSSVVPINHDLLAKFWC